MNDGSDFDDEVKAHQYQLSTTSRSTSQEHKRRRTAREGPVSFFIQHTSRRRTIRPVVRWSRSAGFNSQVEL